MKVSLKKQDIPSANVMYFEKIVKLCEENNVKLVLISTPSMKNWSYSKHMGAKDLAEDNNVSFIDLNLGNVLNINWNKETKDNGDHLNYNGAVKVSNYIGEYLKGLNIVTDHRNDSYYSSWNDNYIIYSNGLK